MLPLRALAITSKTTIKNTHSRKVSKKKYSSRAKLNTLDNGVFVVPTEGKNRLSTVGFVLDAGAVYENDNELGVSRFFEKSVPYVRSSDGKTVSEVLGGFGGRLQTFSTRDRIGVVMQGLNENEGQLVDLAASVISPDAEIAEDDARVVREQMDNEYSQLSKNYDTDFVLEQLHASAFQGTTLANSVYGSSENFGSLNGALLRDYKNRNFTGSRVAVVTAGLDAEKATSKIQSSVFSSLPSGYHDSYSQPDDFVGSDVRIRDDTYPLAQIATGLYSPGRNNEDYYAYLLFQAVCGGYSRRSGAGNNIISQFSEDMAKDIQFVDSFQTFNFNYKNVGLFCFYAHVPPKYLDDYTTLLGTRLQHVAKGTTENDLRIAKNAVKSALAFQASTSAGLVESLGNTVLSRRGVVSLDDIYREIDAVTVKQFKAALKDKFDDTCPAVVSFGPIEEMPDYTFFKQKLGSPLW